ncbi:ADAMTS-like protein 1 [Stegostoma tigrinum]|uniref:ADAMTS-like protein 1 n=1 Tax=Stegostoma tigrinum TaxID=3053191 RepID=UPI00286FC41E|nr:ADAMTS-like protein 1 [Stegostoma tigrinum]
MSGFPFETTAWILFGFLLICPAIKGPAVLIEGAEFLPEFTLIRRESYPEEPLGDVLNHKSEDQSLRIARSEEDGDSQWDAWGPWSECSRTCAGGASYSLRRCLSSRNCEGLNIRYRTCSSVDCPPEAGDFRAQQCSAHNDVKYQGQYYEWLPIYNDPDKPCALKCLAKGTALVVELAPKVLDGTRCYTETLHMCISGNCQVVGCDHQLGSNAKEDNCGVCNGNGSTCRLVRGQHKSQGSSNKLDDAVIAIPYGSRHVRIVLKGPDHLYLETKTLLGQRGENSLSASGIFSIENTSIEFQKFPEKEILRANGPLGADFTVKMQYVGKADSIVQFFFYQPIIHQWRETDFFPCSVTCGGGYQLTSAECYDLRSVRVVLDQYCHYYPENIKPKPKLRECSMDPCPASDGYKQIIPFDHFHPLPRWDSSPWTACSSSCGGGAQLRTVSCVEEDINGQVNTVEEWKCMYIQKFPVVQPCNLFDCPKWLAQEWSPCTVTCGQGLRYRVVLCIDHRGLHAGGCNAKTKPHIKEECIVTVPCYKPKEKLPVEAKLPWYKQAQELEELLTVSEEPSFIPQHWSPCSKTCGAGSQSRKVKCQVLLSFSQSVEDLPDDECEGPKPQMERACYTGPCSGEAVEYDVEDAELLYTNLQDFDELYDWDYEGFTQCSESCAGGVQEANVVCLNKQTREKVDESFCVIHRHPPQLLKVCNLGPCPPRWEFGKWSACSSSCGVGLQTRDVYCVHLLVHESGETVILSDKSCLLPKPDNVQACNQFDCPPSWLSEDWQQCSQSCGGGVQVRQVLCKQRMADGSFVDLAEELCLAPKPEVHRACGNIDCPAEWLASQWLQCSTTCGEGTQRRELFCRKVDKDGVSNTLNNANCSHLPHPPLLRSCSFPPCARLNGKEFKSSDRQGPSILGLRKVYVQLKKERKLQFTTGGQAYLLPKTSVVIRCPVRRFRKPLITWEKDGKHLSSSSHVTVTHFGYIKINRLKPVNIGTYTCVAGHVRDDFVIKIIGNNNKLIDPPSSKQEEAIGKGISNEAISPKDRYMPGLKMNGSKSDKNPFFLNHQSQYDGIILKLLEIKGWSRDSPDSRESQWSIEKDFTSLEDASMESTFPLTYVIDKARLDEIIQAISQQTEDLKDTYATHVIGQLVAEISKGQLDAVESKLKQEEGNMDTSSVKPSFHKITTNGHELSKLYPVDQPTSKESIHPSKEPFKAPVILQKANDKGLSLAAEVIADVGHTISLTDWTSTLMLRCEAKGNPKPVISWTKNGQMLKYSHRIKLLSDHTLQLFLPNKSDVGVYTCTATNPIGWDSLSSKVVIPGKPVIRVSKHDLLNFNSTSVSVDVGSVVKVRLRANITIKCQVNGVPEPTVSWTRDQGQLDGNVKLFQNGSLSIINVTLANQGIYSCHASNPLGHVKATTSLLLQDPPRVFLESKDLAPLFALTGSDAHTIFATILGTKEVLSSGNSVVVGCPVKGYPKPSISWLYNGKVIGPRLEQQHHIQASQQVLRIPAITKEHQGNYSCISQNEAGYLTLKVTLEIAEYEWLIGELIPCSAPCGNKGVRFPKLKCLQDNSIEVDKFHCKDKPQPDIQTVPCNVRDCPPRWIVSSWSPCTQRCGGGTRQRLVSCQKVTAAGILVDLSPGFCAQSGKKPTDSQMCNRQLCSEWFTSNWGQCTSHCVGLRLGIQRRHVFCQSQNGTKLPSQQCSSNTRPQSRRNCTSDLCTVQWRTGSWTSCTSSCGNYGFQSRRVECVHLQTGQQVREQFCSWKHRPVNWQRCNIIPCEKSECRDTTRYCEMVKRLKLCLLSQYKLRCCESCRDI